jgi:hypothetical protein
VYFTYVLMILCFGKLLHYDTASAIFIKLYLFTSSAHSLAKINVTLCTVLGSTQQQEMFSFLFTNFRFTVAYSSHLWIIPEFSF